MTTIKRRSSGSLTKLACVALFIALFLLQPVAVNAQWTTPDASQNINNTNTGNVGIGTTTPNSLLEVKKSQSAGTTIIVDNPFTNASNSAYTGLALKQNGTYRLLVSSVNDNHGTITPGTAQFWNFANGPTVFANNNTETMRISAAGNLGIGTTSPDSLSKLHAYSTGILTRILSETTSPTGYAELAVKGNGRTYAVGVGGSSEGTYGVANKFFLFDVDVSAIRLAVDSSGNVGIGTSNPGRKLEVLATDGEAVRLYRNASNVGWGVNMKFAFNNSNGTPVDYAGVHGIVANATAGAEAGDFVLTTTTSGTLTEKLRVTSAGYVGIGAPTPNYKLDVQGGQINASGGLCIAGDCKTAWSQVGGGSSQWTTAGTTIYYNAGNIGIGTNSPLALLDVRNGDGNFYAGFGYGTNKETFIRAGSSTTGVLHVGDLNTMKTLLQESGGNVGIGTATPNSQYKLDVAGNINSSGTITGNNIVAKYQDVAEWVPSSEKFSAGTVVVLDATRSNEVIGSTQAYDTRVAGVISEQPGIALGEEAANRVLVATTGRVRMKVDATQAAITIGDLLVTSDIPGVAMKSQPLNIGGVQIHRPGTIIGKALEPLARGSGEILVLLSLQ